MKKRVADGQHATVRFGEKRDEVDLAAVFADANKPKGDLVGGRMLPQQAGGDHQRCDASGEHRFKEGATMGEAGHQREGKGASWSGQSGMGIDQTARPNYFDEGYFWFRRGEESSRSVRDTLCLPRLLETFPVAAS